MSDYRKTDPAREAWVEAWRWARTAADERDEPCLAVEATVLILARDRIDPLLVRPLGRKRALYMTPDGHPWLAPKLKVKLLDQSR